MEAPVVRTMYVSCSGDGQETHHRSHGDEDSDRACRAKAFETASQGVERSTHQQDHSHNHGWAELGAQDQGSGDEDAGG